MIEYIDLLNKLDLLKNNDSIFKFNNINAELDKIDKSFNFSSFFNSLNNIDFTSRYKAITHINCAKKWIIENKAHTFPTTECGWINTISSTKNLNRCYKNFDPKIYLPKILKSNYNSDPLILHLRTKLLKYIKIFKLFHGEITKNNFNRFMYKLKYNLSIKYKLKSKEIYDILINSNLLIKENNFVKINYNRIYKNKNIKNSQIISGNKRKVDFLTDDINLTKKNRIINFN